MSGSLQLFQMRVGKAQVSRSGLGQRAEHGLTAGGQAVGPSSVPKGSEVRGAEKDPQRQLQWQHVQTIRAGRGVG